MENFTPFLTCEVIFNFISSFTLFFRFAGSSLRGGGGGAWISTCSAMRRRGSSTVTSVENSSGTPHIWEHIGRHALEWRYVISNFMLLHPSYSYYIRIFILCLIDRKTFTFQEEECAYCGKKFAQRAVLINHERIHTGDWNWKHGHWLYNVINDHW